MAVLLPLIGTVLVLTALVDIFLTVLHPRSESNLLSIPVAKFLWCGFRWLAQGPPKRRDRILSYGGPTIVVALIGVWVLLLLVGFALIVWPALGTGIVAEQGNTPTDFATALYYAGFSLGTLGTGDLVPQTAPYRLLMVLKSLLGFSVFTLVLSYVLSVYNALTSRNTFALSLHHRTADTADSAVLLARLAAGNDASLYHDISDIAKDLTSLLEFNNSYPLLLYFRYRQTYYALPRIVYLAIDTATLINCALNADRYGAVAEASGAAELWYGSIHLMKELDQSIDSRAKFLPHDYAEPLWREHYDHALEVLNQNGIKTTDIPLSGAQSYLSMRHQWAPYLAKLIKHMGYLPSQIYR
ncbi:potassium channel family protein [Nodosilinea sp. PGN35]|uniref:potassium channel family protein n=1 Tax=Nodosilinea sp. PGN35 TaxID=3020489 RepID=UPI0023B31AB4|nr:potassium channel family protein [Nodosilinea sp. TSF1-S3]MDF0369039.1 potassium channel family protein [Nodosilinea sp. TSF1-S3]